MSIITINGKKYNEKKLNSQAKKYVGFLRLTENEIKTLNNKISINKTARNVYGNSIMKNIPQKKAAANRKNGIVTINGNKYLQDDLNDRIKNDILIINKIDRNISELQIDLSIITTSKNVYTQILLGLLQKK